ncbi:MAG: alginate lyase family protein [Candidatus Hydrogenedentes bacterium]|nr:alginate lyase family protein [Candidatus Hydrogenedentota bacterium]
MVINLFFAVLCSFAFAGEEIETLEQLCQTHPERVEGLFAALNLDHPGLESVKEAVASENWPAACEALLTYYREGDTASWLRAERPKPGNGRVEAADVILEGRFTLYTVPAKVPKRADGGLDWTYNGPDGDREWGWGLNRQYWAGELISAYQKTGNPVYIEGYDRYIRDWILANPYRGQKTSAPQWRGLETFMRVNGSLSRGFYALQEVPELTPVTRILILSTIPDHAHYLQHFHAGGGNWISMEMKGLATAAACWPEFKKSGEWFEYAFKHMVPEVEKQVYPDGAQKELTSHYHIVTVRSFDSFANIAHRAGRDVPADFEAGIGKMYNYLAYTMRPSGYGLLNNDSNLDHTAPLVLRHAERFERPDWTYIATNGEKGNMPKGVPSKVFPWAGQMVMRSGWDRNAHWGFFDVGPLGIGHWHYDKLHLSISAFGRDILVDGGRYTYKGGPWRAYFIGSKSHNVVLFDGCEQRDTVREVSEPMKGNYAITPEFDYARGTFAGSYPKLEGVAKHTRAVVYMRGRYWIVVDAVSTDRPRDVTALWHFHPDCTVAAEGLSAVSTDAESGNVRVTPVSVLDWRVNLVKGQEKPEIQGWWSREYNHKTPAVCAAYESHIEGPAVFAWVIVLALGAVPDAEAALEMVDAKNAQVRITMPGAEPDVFVIPLAGENVARKAD